MISADSRGPSDRILRHRFHLEKRSGYDGESAIAVERFMKGHPTNPKFLDDGTEAFCDLLESQIDALSLGMSLHPLRSQSCRPHISNVYERRPEISREGAKSSLERGSNPRPTDMIKQHTCNPTQNHPAPQTTFDSIRMFLINCFTVNSHVGLQEDHLHRHESTSPAVALAFVRAGHIVYGQSLHSRKQIGGR